MKGSNMGKVKNNLEQQMWFKALALHLPEEVYYQIKDEILKWVEDNFVPLDAEVKPANGVDMDNCFYCGHRASELTQIRVAIKPPNTPNRWKVIGVACNTCNDKFLSQIEPSRLSV